MELQEGQCRLILVLVDLAMMECDSVVLQWLRNYSSRRSLWKESSNCIENADLLLLNELANISNFGLPFFSTTSSFEIRVEVFVLNAVKPFFALSLFILTVNTVGLSSVDSAVSSPNVLKAFMASCVQLRKMYRKQCLTSLLILYNILCMTIKLEL